MCLWERCFYDLGTRGVFNLLWLISPFSWFEGCLQGLLWTHVPMRISEMGPRVGSHEKRIWGSSPLPERLSGPVLDSRPLLSTRSRAVNRSFIHRIVTAQKKRKRNSLLHFPAVLDSASTGVRSRRSRHRFRRWLGLRVVEFFDLLLFSFCFRYV